MVNMQNSFLFTKLFQNFSVKMGGNAHISLGQTNHTT